MTSPKIFSLKSSDNRYWLLTSSKDDKPLPNGVYVGFSLKSSSFSAYHAYHLNLMSIGGPHLPEANLKTKLLKDEDGKKHAADKLAEVVVRAPSMLRAPIMLKGLGSQPLLGAITSALNDLLTHYGYPVVPPEAVALLVEDDFQDKFGVVSMEKYMSDIMVTATNFGEVKPEPAPAHEGDGFDDSDLDADPEEETDD